MKAVVPRGPGPWGGHGGKEWDDGVFLGIRELHLHVGDSVIHAIRVLYESRDGKPVWSHKHGGAGGDKINTVIYLFFIRQKCNGHLLSLLKFILVI